MILNLAALATLTLGSAPATFALPGPGMIRITDRHIGGGRVDIGRP